MSKEKIRFIHCSDLHLGANPYQIQDRLNDMGLVFKEVIEYAIDNKVDFVLIPGDLFDKKILNAKTLNQAIDIIKPLNENNIPIYVTEGNHDKATYNNDYSWLDFMNEKGYITFLNPIKKIDSEDESLMLKEYIDEDKENNNGSYIIKDDYIIYGLGYPGVMPTKYVNDLISYYVSDEKVLKDKIIITMLHTGIGHFVTEGMGGIKEDEIDNLTNVSDYIALGHIHNRYEIEDKKCYNPGSLENSSIPKEIEDKGFYDVTISKDKKIDYNFITVSNRKIYNITLDLTDIEDANIAYDEVIKKVSGKLLADNVTKDDKAIMQLKLKGTLKSHGTNIKVRELKQELKNTFGLMYVEIQNNLKSTRDNNITNESLSREEIDKNALRTLISKEGFEDNDIDYLLDITLKMKELTREGELDLSSNDGKEIKNELLKFIRNKNNSNKDKEDNSNKDNEEMKIEN